MFSRRPFLITAFAYLLAFGVSWGQNADTRKLLQELKTAHEDTNKVILLRSLAEAHRSNLPELKKYADAMLELSERLKYERGKANAYKQYFNYHRNLSNFDECLVYAQKMLEIARKLEDKLLESDAYNSFGIVQGTGFNRFDRGLTYFKRSLALKIAIKDPNVETAYNNIANAYNQLNQQLDSALFYVDKAIAIAVGNKKKKRILSVAYSTKGEIYVSLKDWNKAMYFLNKSKQITEEINDFSSHSYLYNYMAEIYLQRKMTDSAEYMYQLSLDVYARKGISSDILKTYAGLAKILEQRGEHKQALKYYKQMAEGQSKSLKEASDKMRELEIQHEKEERAKEKKAQADRIRLFSWLFVVAMVVASLMALFLVYIYRQHKVQKRISQELEKTNREVQEKSQELLSMNEELNSTVEELNLTLETVDQHKQLIELANQRMHDSIKYGKKIQEAILPTEQEMGEAFQDYFAMYLPRDTVSGDFYWYYKLNAKTQFIAVVDCTGHGVPGAFMSMIGYSLLNQILSETHIYETAEILRYLDMGIVQGLRQSNTQNVDGMDVCLCRIDTESVDEFSIDFAGAKRPLYYAENQQIQLIRPTRESIGGFSAGAERHFQSQKISLRKGDILYLTTDGFTDNPNKHRKRFGEERFAKLLQAVVAHDMRSQQELLMSAYNAHQEGTAQRDDITVVGVCL